MIWGEFMSDCSPIGFNNPEDYEMSIYCIGKCTNCEKEIVFLQDIFISNKSVTIFGQKIPIQKILCIECKRLES